MINSILIKPTGPDCNLRCNYCFYRRSAGMFEGKTHRMSDKVLETLIRDAMRVGINTFSWQGGEPTLMGLEFFQKAVELEMRYGRPGTAVANALQTNGTLLDQKWAKFLSDYKFLIGLSIDGPSKLHDHYRKDDKGKPTHSRIMKSAQLLGEFGVEFNILALLNNLNVKQPESVYDFMLEHGFHWLQFVPCIEQGEKGQPAPFAISPDEYGEFLVRIFDRWVEDFPKVSVRDFDDLLMRALGREPGTCTSSGKCGSYFVVEHNGDVFACDFFVRSQWRLGNIMETPLWEIAASERFAEFAMLKGEVGEACRSCRFLDKCWGGCQKHRVVLGGESNSPSYFCKAYKQLYAHVEPVMPELVDRVKRMGWA